MGAILSPKLRETFPTSDDRFGRWLAIWCPGCNHVHTFPVEKPSPFNGKVWSFDGNVEAPTFSPSFSVEDRCHFTIRAGMVAFRLDSKHALAGRTVEIADFPAERGRSPLKLVPTLTSWRKRA